MTNQFKRSQEEWDLHYLRLAKTYSLMSRDPSTKVGCVAVDSYYNRVLSLGYNGFRKNDDDNPALYLDREYKIKNIIHAEENVIDWLKENITDLDYRTYHLYVYPFTSCLYCSKVLIDFKNYRIDENYGSIKLITTDYVPERWETSFSEATELLIKSGIEVINYPIHKV